MSRKKDLFAALFGIVVALILWITILSRETQLGGRRFYLPFHTVVTLMKDIRHAGIKSNFLGNIVLFIPIGVLFPLVTSCKNPWKIAAMGFCFSLLIETIQLVTLKGYFDPDDVIINILGCLIGFALLRAVEMVLRKQF